MDMITQRILPVLAGSFVLVAAIWIVACSEEEPFHPPTCVYRVMVNPPAAAIAVGSLVGVHGGLVDFGKCIEPANRPTLITWTTSAPLVASFSEVTDSSATVIGIGVGTAIVRLRSPETQTYDSVTVTVRAP